MENILSLIFFLVFTEIFSMIDVLKGHGAVIYF